MCGHSLDLLDIITERYHPESTSRRLENQMQMAKTIKTIEEISSQRRMHELENIEKDRRWRMERQQSEREKRDRQLLIFSGIIVAAFVLILIIYGIIYLSS